MFWEVSREIKHSNSTEGAIIEVLHFAFFFQWVQSSCNGQLPEVNVCNIECEIRLHLFAAIYNLRVKTQGQSISYSTLKDFYLILICAHFRTSDHYFYDCTDWWNPLFFCSEKKSYFSFPSHVLSENGIHFCWCNENSEFLNDSMTWW